MQFLKQNTATIVTVGPFFDKTDGVTLETALTISNERISFVVDSNDGSAPTLVLDNVTGATSGTSNDLNYITGNDAALMQLELSAADTNYVGRATLTVTDAANHVPVFHEFMLVPANVYDSLVTGTDTLDVTVSDYGTSALRKLGVVAVGTAQAATSTSIQLASAETFANDEIVGSTVLITGGTTGVGQARLITDYVSSSDTATVDTWTTTPTGTITYVVFATPPSSSSVPIEANLTQIAGVVVSTTTAQLGVNVVQVSGDATAADNAELMFDGTGYAGGTTRLSVNVASTSAGAITSTSIADDAITSAKLADNVVSSEHLATAAVDKISDGLLDRNMATGADSGSPTVRTVRQALRFLRNKWSISGTTLTVTKEDDATTSWTSTVTTNAAADPVTSNDPANS